MISPDLQIALGCLFGVLAGSLSGFLGIGGGAMLPPLLVFILGYGQHKAQGISLAALLPPVGLPAVVAYRRNGVRISVQLVVLLTIGFLLGSPFGAWLANIVPARPLGWLFGLFLLTFAIRSLAGLLRTAEPIEQSTPLVHWHGAWIGPVAGILSGLLGIGGGIVVVPLLRRFAQTSRFEAQATTLAMMLPPIALPALWVYAHEQGGLPLGLVSAVAIGFAGGTGVGAVLSRKASAKTATAIFALVLVGISGLLFAKS